MHRRGAIGPLLPVACTTECPSEKHIWVSGQYGRSDRRPRTVSWGPALPPPALADDAPLTDVASPRYVDVKRSISLMNCGNAASRWRRT